MQPKHILIFGIVLSFVVGISLSNVNAVSPFTEIGNLEMETLAAINDIIIELMVQTERIDSLNATEISEQAEQDGMQIDIANLQGSQTIIFSSLTTINSDISNLQEDVITVITEIDSIMISLNTTMRDHRTAFNNGFGNGSSTIVVSHKTYENANVTVTLEYLESSRQFNNGTARSFQLTDDVLLLGDSKIFIETFIVPLGVLFSGTQGFVESCVILPTEDPNICARTTSIEPGDELKIFFKVDLGGIQTGMNSNIITTRITSEVIT